MSSLQVIPHFSPSIQPAASIKPSSRNEVIKQIALSSLKDWGIGIGMVGFTSLFMINPAAIGINIVAITVVALGCFAFRMRAVYKASKELSETNNPKHPEVVNRCLQSGSWIRSAVMGIIYGGTVDTVVHESGHSFMARVVYKNPHPHMTVFPFKGGVTTFVPDVLSETGRNLGAHKAGLLVAAAGALAALSMTLVMIIVAHGMGKKKPDVARHLHAMGLMSLLNHITYALSSFQKKPPEGHDFVRLWREGGIHPVIPLVMLIGLPLLVKGVLCLMDHVRSRYSESPREINALTV